LNNSVATRVYWRVLAYTYGDSANT
jgi:hypothetical protein